MPRQLTIPDTGDALRLGEGTSRVVEIVPDEPTRQGGRSSTVSIRAYTRVGNRFQRWTHLDRNEVRELLEWLDAWESSGEPPGPTVVRP